MMQELLQSETYVRSNVAVLVAVVIFLISHFLCSVQGMGRNKIGKVSKSLNRASKSLSLFIAGSEREKLERSRARKLLLDLRVRVRNSSSVLQVYLYEGYDNPTVNQIIAKLAAVENECDDVAVDYNNSKKDEMMTHLQNMKKMLEQASIMLSSVRTEIEEDSKKVI